MRHAPPNGRRLFRLASSSERVERDVDDELQFHFDMTMRDLMAKGLNADEARREAERRFGDASLTRERLTQIDRQRVGQERRAEWWSALAQDLKYALRSLRLKPGFAAVVVIALALGIGANATMFGIVDRLLFRPPPYLIAPERTHHLYFQRNIDGQVVTGNSSQYQRFVDISNWTRTAEIMAAYATRRAGVGVAENTRQEELGAVTASLWQLFDAKPVIGRFFGPNEDRDPGGARVVVLSYGYWQSQYAGSDSVLGKVMHIGPTQWTIIGVAPRGFAATQMKAPIAFIPIAVSAVDEFGSIWERYRTAYNFTWLEVFARRKEGISVTAMAADLTSAYRRSYEVQTAIERRTTPIDVAKPRVVIHPVFEERGPEPSATTKVATWLLGVAGVVLLIACANVGNLLLGRAVRRRREIAVRMALGIGRARLASQLLIESMLLAVLGACAGLLVAHWGGNVLQAVLMPQVEWQNAIADGRVLLFAGATAVIAGVLAGIAPIFQSGRTDVAIALKAGAREGYGHRSRLRASLLVMQAALSVVLLVGAGLFVRSLQNVNGIDMGYDVEHLVWFHPQMRGTQLDSAEQLQLYERLKQRAREYPGVEDVTVALTVPFSRTYSDDVYLPGQDSASKLGDFIMQGASTGYFAATGTRIISGRGFTADDRSGSPLVVVVSKAIADGLWPQQDPIGKCIKTSADTSPCRSVIGVAEDVKFGSFASDWNLFVYLPEAQLGSNSYSLFVRTRGDAAIATDGLRRFMQERMPGIAYLTARPMNDVISPQMRSWQLGATMFTVFGGLALALAAIGLYSVVAHSVVQRTHEVGVRVALGARSGDVIGLIVRESVGVVLVGVVVGAAAAMTAARWVKPLLFEVSPRDPIVLSIVGLLLPAVAVAASMIPALRASRVDPNVALRAD